VKRTGLISRSGACPVPVERRVLALLTEFLHQRAAHPDDRDLTIVGQLVDELAAQPATARRAILELGLAASGSLELAGDALDEDPAEILRAGAVGAGWIE
jgi:hypothetical protein